MNSRHASVSESVEFISNRENDTRYTDLFDGLLRQAEISRWAVAFVRKTGVERFSDALKEARRNNSKIRCLTAFDFQQTQPSALLALLDYGVDIRLAAPGWGTYHPKVYLFSKDEKHSAIVGSANLTGGAFEQNVEAGVYLNGGKVIGEIGTFFSEHWNDVRTIPVTEELLRSRKDIPDIWTRTATHETLLLESTKLKARMGKTVVQRIQSVMKKSEWYSITEVTNLVLRNFPDWDYGLTPSASIRRDLNYNSTRHLPLSAKPLFEAERGKYKRIR